uniref:Uncharacterized protein n=1 Tax=Leersia perrieri TaxID=77586 RepID=A0A0D9V7A3_9ORYZ
MATAKKHKATSSFSMDLPLRLHLSRELAIGASPKTSPFQAASRSSDCRAEADQAARFRKLEGRVDAGRCRDAAKGCCGFTAVL